MQEYNLFPNYIPRQEEQLIRREAARVRKDGSSRAVLLYGPGGIGKTWLVREMARPSTADDMTVWLDPIDVDDSEYWLLSNLERQVAARLDPDNQYFEPYQKYLSRLPSYTRPRIGHETVVSHLGRIKQVFLECYKEFVEGSGKTVVIVFDTVETIRGMYLLLTLTQWMKALPATLFILSGRPLPAYGDTPDPIKTELEDPHQWIPVTTVHLGQFTQAGALEYLNRSSVAAGLSTDEKEKLVLLTRGHPLWLAFTIAYLNEKGLPEEMAEPLSRIEREAPYQGDMTPDGQILHEAFKRRLVTPYRESDFWHEAIKRLAVVRQSVNRFIWQRLMIDRPLPQDASDIDEAWEMLLQIPWIRPRANRRYVTLHDAVAEQLAQRVIPLHDQDRRWRRELWQRAAAIYIELTEGPEAELTGKFAALDEGLRLLDERRQRGDPRRPLTEESTFIQEIALLDGQKRQIDQFKAAGFFYRLLGDFAEGCRQFLDLVERGKKHNDVLFQELLALEMQRFLPGGVNSYAFGDVIGNTIDEFREWLSSTNPGLYLEIGLSIADYLVGIEQPEPAIELLASLPVASAAHRQRYHLKVLWGNAFMRIPGRMKDGLPHLRQALMEAEALTSPDRQNLIADAHKELGFYYRNEGMWQEADDAYRQARDAILPTLSAQSSDEDREEMASIQTNWAYIKGLVGSYRDAANLVESAIAVRRRFNQRQEEGSSWSVCGEVYRYERRFQRAWDAYTEAEEIFHELRSWSWLGLIYQEQAICLFQAAQEGISLTPFRDPLAQSKHLITLALDICHDQNIRGYPSALNRAGRIFGADEVESGLRYLVEGIDWARRLSDGWFWFANLIEYVELNYRAWVATGEQKYLTEIAAREADIMRVMMQYEFADLRGRWNLLQGHLGIRHWLETGDDGRLSAALNNYKEGFALIAIGYAASSGANTIPGEFTTFGELFAKLSPDIRAEWIEQLRRAWAVLDHGSTLLLARLEQLY